MMTGIDSNDDNDFATRKQSLQWWDRVFCRPFFLACQSRHALPISYLVYLICVYFGGARIDLICCLCTRCIHLLIDWRAATTLSQQRRNSFVRLKLNSTFGFRKWWFCGVRCIYRCDAICVVGISHNPKIKRIFFGVRKSFTNFLFQNFVPKCVCFRCGVATQIHARTHLHLYIGMCTIPTAAHTHVHTQIPAGRMRIFDDIRLHDVKSIFHFDFKMKGKYFEYNFLANWLNCCTILEYKKTSLNGSEKLPQNQKHKLN